MHGMPPSILAAQLDESPNLKWILFFENQDAISGSKSLHPDL
jgi:hypothetical protein